MSGKVCPSCYRPGDGLLCDRIYAGRRDISCTATLERDLADVPGIAADLEDAVAKLVRDVPGRPGLAHERNPWGQRASIALGALNNTLTTWARDVSSETWQPTGPEPVIAQCAAYLLSRIPEIRRHPAASQLVDEVIASVAQAREDTDRPANRTRFKVGPCPEDTDTGPCPGVVMAFIPTEDDRPSWLRCQADDAHKWASHQFYRAGERIRRRMEANRARKDGAA